MKKYIAGLALAICSINYSAHAQNHGIGLHFGAYDFYGPQTGDYITSERLTYEYNDKRKLYDTAHHNKMYWKPMVKVSYWYQINSSFDVNLGLSFASLEYPKNSDDTDYVNRNRTQSGDRKERNLTEFDVRFNYSILSRDRWIASPYIFAGVNASYHDIFLGVDIPLGIGLNIGLNKARTISLNLESAYKIAATDHDVNHLQHSLGFVYWFKPGYKVATVASAAAVAEQAPLLDSDNDGIEDSEDACPTIAGLAQFNGCPDTDGDGISDKDDACPLVAGLAQFNGCPDSDGDGIPDQKDKCPYVAGTAERDGCPVADKDGDGFPDDVDRCPNVYSKTNQGCPEIRKEVISEVEKAAKAIFFETGKATIKPISFKSLDAVVRILKNDPTNYADIEGHTDNVQPKSYTNMDLSQRRAESVKDYFVSKGVDASRLTSQGFGETQPVADNATAPGRAQNRRTVIKLRNFTK
jgi:outer membrane protein OmpA-like peptidoglycan-associated protein